MLKWRIRITLVMSSVSSRRFYSGVRNQVVSGFTKIINNVYPYPISNVVFSTTAAMTPSDERTVKQTARAIAVTQRHSIVQQCVGERSTPRVFDHGSVGGPHVMLYEFHQVHSASGAARNINGVQGQGAVDVRKCQRWFQRFRSEDNSLSDKPREGRPVLLNNDAL